MRKKKIFLICPVRYGKKLTRGYKKNQERIKQYVEQQEKMGYEVYWQLRDTNQNDPIGLRICTDNGLGIFTANEVRVWWLWKEKKWWQKWMWWTKEKKSTGSLFDFGMSFICHILTGKPIILANPEDVKPTKEKSFNNVLLALHILCTKKEINKEEKRCH